MLMPAPCQRYRVVRIVGRPDALARSPGLIRPRIVRPKSTDVVNPECWAVFYVRQVLGKGLGPQLVD